MARPNPFLFPGEQPDRHKGKGALSSQIRDLVYAYTRLEMPAHRFRQPVGKIYLDRHPGQYEVVRQLLGHKDIKTTIAFYAGAESASAARLTIARSWASDPAASTGRPPMTDSAKPNTTRLCLPVAHWPAADRAAWAAAHRRGGLLDDDGRAAVWAVATSSIIAGAYGRFLSFLAARGDLDPGARPQDRVTRPRVEAYVGDLREINHSSTVAARILQLSRVVAIMAPELDWAWLRRIGARLRRMATPARDDRARLLPARAVIDLLGIEPPRSPADPTFEAAMIGRPSWEEIFLSGSI